MSSRLPGPRVQLRTDAGNIEVMLQLPPWARGTAEIFRHAEGHFRAGGDTDRRIALIGFDNAIEVSIDTYLGLHPRNRGGHEVPRAVIDQARRNYHTKIEFLESLLRQRDETLGASIEHVIWYHQLRNELYHSGNGMTPEGHVLEGARASALAVFRALFGADATAISADATGQAPEELRAPAPSQIEDRGSRLLRTYILFEQTLRSRLPLIKQTMSVPEMWRVFRDRVPELQQYEKTVSQATVLRNAAVHGGSTSMSLRDEAADSIADVLEELTAAIAGHPPVGPPPVPAGTIIIGEALAIEAYAMAKGLDPNREGIRVSDIGDLMAIRGYTVPGDPYKTVYNALNQAQDMFRRPRPGFFVWRDGIQDRSGLSGNRLLAEVSSVCGADLRSEAGLHYQDILRRVEAAGFRVRGPNPGRTLNIALNTPRGKALFVRAARGVYRASAETT